MSSSLPSAIQSEHGYTLVEVAIAIGLSFLIVGLVYSTYLMGNRFITTWHDGLRLDNELHQTSVQFTRDVHRARSVARPDAHTLQLVAGRQDTTVYRWQPEEGLRRNGRTILSAALPIEQAVFRTTAITDEQATGAAQTSAAHTSAAHTSAAHASAGRTARIPISMVLTAPEEHPPMPAWTIQAVPRNALSWQSSRPSD
jgi:Tfp pilus assembly protein PilW